MFWDAPLGAAEDVVLVFGRETAGLPEAVHERYAERMVAMPIASPLVRSLNLSTYVWDRGVPGTATAAGARALTSVRAIAGERVGGYVFRPAASRGIR